CKYLRHWYLLCASLHPFDVHWFLFDPAQLVRWLRLLSRVELLYGIVMLFVWQRRTLLPAGFVSLSRGRGPACRLGRKQPCCQKTNSCCGGRLRLICRGLSRLSFAYRL